VDRNAFSCECPGARPIRAICQFIAAFIGDRMNDLLHRINSSSESVKLEKGGDGFDGKDARCVINLSK
jgi:hypothetical protein